MKIVFGLRAKIIGMAAVTLGGVLVAVAAYDARSDARVIEESRKAEEDLTQAMQVSVQQLGRSTEAPDQELLRDYTKRLGRTGVRQIQILDPDKNVLAGTSNPAHPMLIEQEPKSSDDPETWDLLVPVVFGPRKLGYVQLRMTSKTFEELLGDIRNRRTLVTAFAFAAGLLLSGVIASQITGPLGALRKAAQRVAKGDLDVALPKASGRDEVGQLVESFTEMVDGLREHEKLKDRLVAAERDALLGRVAAGIAHDVRNPLNYVSLAIDHLVSSPGAPDAAHIAAQMKKELARANERIGEFLRLGKPVEIHPQEVRIESVLDAVARPASTAAHKILVRAGEAGAAWWDAAVVEGILRNLITNAIQASGDAGDVEISAEAGEGKVSIHVDDRGVGLSAETLERIFEPWFTTKSDGVGLGLALARRAAREHGGDLAASPREGGGARFTLTLPRDGRGKDQAAA